MSQPDIRSLASAWDVNLDGLPIQTTEGVIAYGTHKGQPVCIKALGDSFDAAGSRAALEYYAGRGAVAVLASAPHAILIERLLPGTSLEEESSQEPLTDDVAVFCDVALALHESGAEADHIPLVQTWTRSFSNWNEGEDIRLPRTWVEHACSLFANLAKSESTKVVLHGDLHHGNILLDADRGWLAIDPKGVIGDPAFEAAAFLRNPMSQLEKVSQPQVIQARIEEIYTRTGWDRARVCSWAYCQNVLSTIWCV